MDFINEVNFFSHGLIIGSFQVSLNSKNDLLYFYWDDGFDAVGELE